MEQVQEGSGSKLKSRFGFIMLAAGSAIGLGNVWKFPYVVGQNGGGVFLFVYLLLLAIFGIPILTIELSIGRKSQKPPVQMYEGADENKGKYYKWHGFTSHAGIIITNMFYTVVTAWICIYIVKSLIGTFNNTNVMILQENFRVMNDSPLEVILVTIGVIVVGFGVCAIGIQKGLEKVTKILMIALFVLIVVLAINSICLPNSIEGLKFFFVPDFAKAREVGFFKIFISALEQCFFTLGVGIGGMEIFGSYLNKERKLFGEAMTITILDTLIAIIAGIIIFPACSSFGIPVDSGPNLLFITMPQVFSSMGLSQLWSTLFFIFMSFAALSSIFTMFECMIGSMMQYLKMKRPYVCLIAAGGLSILIIPVVLGFNVWKDVKIFDMNIFDICNFLTSSIIMPIGALVMTIFACSDTFGWGFDNFLEEANTGKGLGFPKWSKWYMKVAVPIIILVLFVFGIVNNFVKII